MRGIPGSVLAVSVFLTLSAGVWAQDPVEPAVPSQLPPPPATKLEAFQPPAGSVFSVAYERLGNTSDFQIYAVEMRDAQGKPTRGLIAYLSDKRSYVDAEEIPGLIDACDALLQLGGNPTSLRTYESRYATRGNLQLIATISERRGTAFSLIVGRFETARRDSLNTADIQQLRFIFSTALEKLAASPQ